MAICFGLGLTLVACARPVADEVGLPIEAYAVVGHEQDSHEFHIDLPMPPVPGGFAQQLTTEPEFGEETTQAQTNSAATAQLSMYALMRDVADTFGSGRFYLRGRASSASPAMNNALVVIAESGNRSVYEHAIDWAHETNSAAQAATMRGVFGNTARMLMLPTGTYMTFPARYSYFSFMDFTGGVPTYAADFDILGDFKRLNITSDITYIHITIAGRMYRMTTLPIDGGFANFIFYNNQLRRVEAVSDDDDRIFIEVDTFHRNPPESIFSMVGMRQLSATDLLMWLDVVGGVMF